jgi:hypothetical protein
MKNRLLTATIVIIMLVAAFILLFSPIATVADSSTSVTGSTVIASGDPIYPPPLPPPLPPTVIPASAGTLA